MINNAVGAWQSICNLLDETKVLLKKEEEKRKLELKIIKSDDTMEWKTERLRYLQNKIEDATILFDEKSIYKSSLNLFDRLTCDGKGPPGTKNRTLNMRNTLLEKIDDKYIIDVLNSLEVYTTEVLVIYALGQVFHDVGRNCPIVKAATMVDKLGSIILKERIPACVDVYKVVSSESEDEDDTEVAPIINISEKCKKLGGAIRQHFTFQRLIDDYR